MKPELDLGQSTMACSADPGNRARAQRAEEYDADWQTLLDSALDCIICTDEQSRITDFNAAAERTFRTHRSQVVGRHLTEVILPSGSRDRYERVLFSSNVDTGIDVVGNRLETRAMRSDGTTFPAELTLTSINIKGKSAFTVYVRDITARKRAEEALVWLAAIVESSQDAIIGKDLDRKITSWNKGAELMYGYTAEEMIGKDIGLLVPPDRAEETARIMEALRAGRKVSDLETVRVTKGGKLINVSLNVSPVLDSDGTMIGASAIAHDITAHKAAEKALRRANETSIYASPVPIIAADAYNRVSMWNAAAEKLFGWSEMDVIGKPNPVIPQDELERAAMLHRRLLSGETITGVEVRRLKKDGSFVSISLSAAPLWDANHDVKGIIGFLTDITERKHVEEALRRAEEKYRGIFENAFEGIYQTTPDGKYVAANPALARMLGFNSPEELIRQRTDVARQEYVDSQRRLEFINAMNEHGVVTNFEYPAYRKDGKVIWVSENAHAVRDAHGEIAYFEGTVQDITRHRELEEQVRQMQKIEAVSRLAGGVAHDLNNILMAISSYAELLYGRIPEQDPSRGYVDEVMKATDRAASLTRGLLTFSRKQVLSPQVLDLNGLLTEQINMLRRLIPANIAVKFVAGEALGKVKLDPTQMEQVVMNLVINARDAMCDGGELIIETCNAELEPADCVLANAPGQYVMLSVSDNGCGMDSATKSHLFEPFFTTKEQGEGTGLGLAIVFGIVKQSLGQIFVHSEPGHGTTFKVYLPRIEAVPHPHKEKAQASFRGHETILLVEDEVAVRESSAEYLTANGYTVLKASNGPEALKIAEKQTQPLDLMLTDVVMPQMSGRELAEKIGLIHPETRVVFMSGYSNNLLSTQQVLNPDCILLQKPFRLTALGRCIRDTLKRGIGVGAGK
jgi:two-component system, cell cycle sensor histidine kinase and response regulator CckA